MNTAMTIATIIMNAPDVDVEQGWLSFVGVGLIVLVIIMLALAALFDNRRG